MDRWETLDFRYRVVEQNQASQVGNPDYGDSGVQQIDVKFLGLFGLCQWQCDVKSANAERGETFFATPRLQERWSHAGR